mmetsp:Transcript_2675/g.4679  ORF Transcript_2675/g.4679 Transcript_2675/m.4679 type:complete len:255 (-) Transcript_2675:625-1389(-)
MFPQQPTPFLLDDGLPLICICTQRVLLFALLRARELVHFTAKLHQSFGFALVLLHLHAALVLADLFQAIVLGELLHELLAHLGLILPRAHHLLLLASHLNEVRVLHLLPIFQLLAHPHLVEAARFSLELLEVQLVAQDLQLLGFLVLGLHFAQHGVENASLLLFLFLAFTLHAFLALALVAGELLDALVLCALFGFDLLLVGLLFQHELLQHLARLHLFLRARFRLLGVFIGDLGHQLLNLLSFLDVFLQSLFT